MRPAGDIVQGIDHLIVMVPDLTQAERTWRGLGFHTTPRGVHRSGGTANHLVMLDHTYIELLGLADPTANSPYRGTMENDPGPAGIALRGIAAETYGYWLAAGFQPSPPESLERGVDIDRRAEVARFRLTRLPCSPELPFLLFCCEQLTPQFVWRRDQPPHANGASTLKELVIVCDGPRTPARLAHLAGRPLPVATDGGSLELGDCRVTFLSPHAFRQRFGSEASFRLGDLPRLAALGLASTDPSRAQQLAQAAGWRARSTGAGGFIVHVPADGVVIEWSPTT